MKVYEIIYLFLPNPDKPAPKIFATKTLRHKRYIYYSFFVPWCLGPIKLVGAHDNFSAGYKHDIAHFNILFLALVIESVTLPILVFESLN